MAQYIDKDAIVAEIEKIRAKWFGINNDFSDGQKMALTDVLSFINTLEVKEVDLEKEKIKKASILHSFAIRNQEVEDEDFIEGAEWAIRQMRGESVSEDLEEAAFDYAEACKYEGGEKLLCVEHFKAGAQWQKNQTMAEI